MNLIFILFFQYIYIYFLSDTNQQLVENKIKQINIEAIHFYNNLTLPLETIPKFSFKDRKIEQLYLNDNKALQKLNKSLEQHYQNCIIMNHKVLVSDIQKKGQLYLKIYSTNIQNLFINTKKPTSKLEKYHLDAILKAEKVYTKSKFWIQKHNLLQIQKKKNKIKIDVVKKALVNLNNLRFLYAIKK